MAGTTIQVAVAQGITFQHTGVFDVTFYGAKSDGSADSSGGEQAAVDACEAAGGGTVYYPPGTYTRVSTHVTVPSAVEIRFLGDAVWIDGASTADHAFVFSVGNGAGDYPTFPFVRFEGLGFKNFEWRAVEQSSYETGGITRLEVVNCKFDNVAFGLYFYSRIESALIQGNLFENASSDEIGCLFIGSKRESDVEYCGNYIIKDNIALNLESTHATDASTIFQAFGRDVIYDTNIIENIDVPNATTHLAGPTTLGVKAYNVCINGNILNNAGGNSDGHIYVKGLGRGDTGTGTNGGPSFAITITNNTVISTEVETWNGSESAISIDTGAHGTDNVHVHENYIEGMNAAGIKIEGTADHDDMSVSNNTIYGTKDGYGIRVFTPGSRISITDNKISGIGVGTSTDPMGIFVIGTDDLTDLVIKGNIITDNGFAADSGHTFGISVQQTVGDMLRPIIKGNIITLSAAAAAQQGIRMYIAGTATITNGIITGNEIDITDADTEMYQIANTQVVCYRDKGTGSPVGVVDGRIGDTFRRLDGGAATSFYVKESGDWTTAGWVGK